MWKCTWKVVPSPCTCPKSRWTPTAWRPEPSCPATNSNWTGCILFYEVFWGRVNPDCTVLWLRNRVLGCCSSWEQAHRSAAGSLWTNLQAEAPPVTSSSRAPLIFYLVHVVVSLLSLLRKEWIEWVVLSSRNLIGERAARVRRKDYFWDSIYTFAANRCNRRTRCVNVI